MSQADALSTALVEATGSAEDKGTVSDLEVAAEGIVLASTATGLSVGQILLDAVAHLPAHMVAPSNRYARRNGVRYELRPDLGTEELTFVRDADLQEEFSLDVDVVLETVEEINAALMALELLGSVLRVSIADLLQLRNLSSLVSSVVASELDRQLGRLTFLNPHQDGYPDLIALTPDAASYRKRIEVEGRMSDKEAWTSPDFGGVEVKATVGNTVPASQQPKPGIGEERSPLIVSFDWKAHHRETNNLLSVIWDFVDGVPTISAVFFRNDLVEDDWGNIVTPRSGGGRTTSVSVMKQSGVRKMAAGWLVRSYDDGQRSGLSNGRLLV